MANKLKNIIEDIAADLLKVVLTLRYDICTCELCKNDMLAYVLSRIPAKYVTTEEESLRAIFEQTRIENQAQIARELIKAIEIVSENPPHQIKENREESFTLLLNKIFQDRGLDFRHYRRALLKRRIALRMRANNLDSYSKYLRLLINKPDEYDKLFEVLTINVSEFFRDPDVWNSVRVLLENLIKAKKKNNNYSIKMWSAGCANGEEAYSAAIIVKELLKADKQFSVKIWGTDIDHKCIQAAQIADFNKEALKNVKPEYLKTSFESIGGRYRLNKEIKDLVEFKCLDLITAEHLEGMDVVFCRNVFIYFNRSLQEMLLMKLYKSLQTGGYLIMGKVETILREAKEIFTEINFHERIYQKK